VPTCHFLGAEGFAPIRESQNTQSPRLSFRALLTEGADPRVQLHRAGSSPLELSQESNPLACTGGYLSKSLFCSLAHSFAVTKDHRGEFLTKQLFS
jgi:hypothetical protein